MNELPRSVGRCDVTGNPCGTDTWVEGDCCPCTPCRRWVMHQWGETIAQVTEHDEWKRKERVLRNIMYENLTAAEEKVKMYEEFNDAPDDADWVSPHPIFLLAEENDYLRAQLADKIETFEEWKDSVVGCKELADSIVNIALEKELDETQKVLRELLTYPISHKDECVQYTGLYCKGDIPCSCGINKVLEKCNGTD